MTMGFAAPAALRDAPGIALPENVFYEPSRPPAMHQRGVLMHSDDREAGSSDVHGDSTRRGDDGGHPCATPPRGLDAAAICARAGPRLDRVQAAPYAADIESSASIVGVVPPSTRRLMSWAESGLARWYPCSSAQPSRRSSSRWASVSIP